MSESKARPNPIVPLAGVATGIIAVISMNFFLGGPFPFPWSVNEPLSEPVRVAPATAAAKAPAADAAGEGVYKTACAACHQADGKGLPGAFPPLAGSEWVTGDAETPIRVVLKGLSGPLQVAGQSFTSMMPAPPGLDDAKVAQVVTYIRAAFGNTAGAVTADTVAKVRSDIATRTTPWTADELTAARGAAAP